MADSPFLFYGKGGVLEGQKIISNLRADELAATGNDVVRLVNCDAMCTCSEYFQCLINNLCE
jgi:hypothetical protein